MNETNRFDEEVRANIAGLRADADMKELSRLWVQEVSKHRWAYNFRWLGRPAIQFPTDAWALQELIWTIRPDVVVETGVARGGSVLFSASILALLDLCDAEAGQTPRPERRRVIGVEVDLRPENRKALAAHPLGSRVTIVDGSSTDLDTFSRVEQLCASSESILVCLDSNHTHAHVLKELELYSGLVRSGSYLVVYDTVIEHMPSEMFHDRPWGVGNNPMTAVREFLTANNQFEIDEEIAAKLQITVAPSGFLRRR